jgi:pimeloyl-ACP methyl ester carboxylesterase
MRSPPAAPGTLARPDGATIAYHRLAGDPPGIVFLGGFRSDMTGTKATYLEDYCRRCGHAYIRFDYFAHGASSGDFAQATIGRWAADAVAVVESLTVGPQILVGSSLGGWIMLLAALARPERVRALVGIAAAPDFTEGLFWQRLDDAQQREFRSRGVITLPSEYDPAGYTYYRHLFDEAKSHLVMRQPIAIDCPVRLLHGMQDEAVPWQRSLALADRLRSRDVTVTLVKDGDHRLSTAADLARLAAALDGLLQSAP